jgi:GNAT superfamily N-acetyltransferase
MNFLTDLKIKTLSSQDFPSAMEILDNELGKNRVRSYDFLERKFKENSNYFIGIYIDNTLVGVIFGFPREDYLLMSEIAIDSRFQGRGFGEKLVKEFEKKGFEKYNKINAGALDDAIEFYKKIKYKPFLLVQFEKGTYTKEDFSEFKINSIKEYGIELDITKCNLIELNKLRKKYPKASLQYIFTKSKNL